MLHPLHSRITSATANTCDSVHNIDLVESCVAERPLVWAQVWPRVMFACILSDSWHTMLGTLSDFWRLWDLRQHKDRVFAPNRKCCLARDWIDLYVVGVPYKVFDPQ